MFRLHTPPVLIALLLCSLSASAQNKLHLLAHFDNKHGTTSGISYSGSWGYVGPDGREYAILGTATGTAVIEITDTAAIHEIAHVGGATSIWREMRTYGHYLYIVSEGGLGTQIVDLSALPAGVDHLKNFVYTSGSKNTQRAHTIEIFDGYMYLNGCANWSPGGTLIFSLADPENPQFVGEYIPPGSGSDRYIHDCYVRHDTLFAASIYTNGGLNIASVADKSSPAHIAKISYGGSGTHNAWTTADGRYAITTDEIGSTVKSLKFWDLSTLPTPPVDPLSTFQYTPFDIEHNVFVRGKYAYTAWYTAGIVVVDVHNPAAPYSAGWYDTSVDSLYPPGSYDGVWAVYPYFWSGKVTAGDMQNGLYVFSFDSLQARTPTSLIEPADQSELCSSAPITFRWSRVADSLRDPHAYWLHLSGQSFDSTFTLGNDTSYTLANPQVLGGGTFSWHILTVDEVNRVSSQDTFTFFRPSIELTEPNGGELVKIFSQAMLSWNWQCPDSVEISFSTDGGSVWSTIAVVPDTQHSFLWDVPALPTTQARIRVRSTTDTSRADVSDSSFTIFNSGSITVTSPNGGELWKGGELHQIAWTSILVDSIKIEFSTDNGSTWSTLVPDTLASTGAYDWTTPNILTSQGVVRITDLDNGTVSDESDAPFFLALITIAMNEGWNLTSLPVDPVFTSSSANFSFASSRAFSYSGSYFEADTVTKGFGYWVKYDSATTIGGLGPLLDSITIPLSAQWNMIGSISTALPVSSLTGAPDSLLLSSFFGYTSDSGYTVADTIVPGKGYWVKASLPGWLMLSSSLAHPASRIRIIRTNELPPPPPDDGEPRATAPAPSDFLLGQNYPNPFNPTTEFRFQIPQDGHVSLKIYDVLGREIAVLMNEERPQGYYSRTWNALESSSGMYVARMIVTDRTGKQLFEQTRKILLLK